MDSVVHDFLALALVELYFIILMAIEDMGSECYCRVGGFQVFDLELLVKPSLQDLLLCIALHEFFILPQ